LCFLNPAPLGIIQFNKLLSHLQIKPHKYFYQEKHSE
jgi:hypothetical protein